MKTAVPGADPFATTNAFIIWFVGKVKPGGDWDYKRLNTPDRNYEAFGNFHYGAVGGAAEFTLDQLLKAAGLVQQWAGDEKGDGGSANIINALTGKGGEPPFGDQVRDQERIKTGYNYYRQKFYWQACK